MTFCGAHIPTAMFGCVYHEKMLLTTVGGYCSLAMAVLVQIFYHWTLIFTLPAAFRRDIRPAHC